MKPPSISVIIPVYSANRYLAEMLEKLCLAGLRDNAGRGLELVIVDDASPLEKETANAAENARAWAGVSYLRNPENLGYVRSVNRGLAAAGGETLMICNSDTRLAPGALDALAGALYSDEKAGIAGPVSNGAFSSSIQQAGGCPAPMSSFSPDELRRFDDFGRGLAESGAAPFEAGWLLGFCTLMRRDLFRAIGPLDEGFGYGYLEEADYAFRARRAGWKLLVAPSAFVFHGGLRRGSPLPNAGSQTARLFPLRTALRQLKGNFHMVRKYGWRSFGVSQDAEDVSARGF
jgi:GT2 family glycosyltransferase